jgi:outer membrane protein OmpA-like peptidoglycan-associated protein
MLKKQSFFWASYADLMTSLFFIMLVLFVLTAVILKKQARASEQAIEKINQVVTALQLLDTNYFDYDEKSLRYKLNIDIVFRRDDDNIERATSPEKRDALVKAGESLYGLMENVVKTNPEINYLLIVEGNTQRALLPDGTWNNESLRDVGYNLSYRRALSLVNFWASSGLDFKDIDNCEVLISGSGYYGKSREKMVNSVSDSPNNRKFTIQITPKIGKIDVN